jgi:FKBP-type peptidyl-prolyl cis-trans isomerase FklB
MLKLFITAVMVLSAGMVLAANAAAQQTPSSSPPPPVAKASAPIAAKAPQTTAVKKTPAGSKSPAALVLTTDKDKTSYAIGLSMGKGMQRDSVDVDPSILARGLKDALTGAKPLLTEDETQALMVALQNNVRKAQEEKMQQVGEKNKADGEAFLAANKTKDGVVTLPSGLQYKILTQGTGPKPTAGDSVVCNYRGTLINGTEFDSSYKRGQPSTFPVGQVIKAWTEALQLMPVGSKWQLFIPSDLAYGARGAGADIGPNATLIFEVELLSIKGK